MFGSLFVSNYTPDTPPPSLQKRKKFWPVRVFFMTQATSSCSVNPKIHLWLTSVAENNLCSELLNRKQAQPLCMSVELSWNFSELPFTKLPPPSMQPALPSSSPTWLAAPTPAPSNINSSALHSRLPGPGLGHRMEEQEEDGSVFVGVD